MPFNMTAGAVVLIALILAFPPLMRADTGESTTTEILPVPAGFGATCNGVDYEMTWAGFISIKTHLSISTSGNWNLFTTTNYQGVTGVGTSDSNDGVKYQVVGTDQFHYTQREVGVSSKLDENFSIIGQGAGTDFLGHAVVHQTINANGTVTSTVELVSAECR